MPARVQLVVEANDATGGIFRSLASELGGLGNIVEEVTSKNISWGNVATQVTGAVIDGLKHAITSTQEYGEAVRDQMLISGQSAEASSRFLQVLDDYQLSAEDAKAATKALTREGLAPTVETVAELSRQYLELNTAQEKNAFAQKNLGRAGVEWLNLLEKGPDAIMAMNDAVSESLVWTEENVRATEEYRLMVDQLHDTWQGYEMFIGTRAIPVVNDLMEAHMEGSVAIKEQTTWWDKQVVAVQESIEAWKDLLGLTAEEGIPTETELNELLAEQAEILTQIDYKGLINDTQKYQNELDRNTKKNQELRASEMELLVERAELEKQLKSVTTQYGSTSKAAQDITNKIGDVNKKIGDNKQALADNAKAHQEWAAQTVFSFAQARAAADGSISELEGEILVEAGEALGLFDQQTADTMRSVNEAFDSLDTSNAQAVLNTLQTQLQELVNADWIINVGVNAPFTTGGGAGGGGSGESGGGQYIPVQTGGMVYAGNPYLVGERGPEHFFPGGDGRVIGHAEALHALSMGGGGSTNIFYGNVTISPDSNAGGDIMSLR